MMNFIYKEPLEILEGTLTNLKSLNHSDKLHVYIGFEERTPDLKEKVDKIMKQYGDVFAKIICTVHPFGVEGEIPGKCSNSNYVLRQIHSDFVNKKDLNTAFGAGDFSKIIIQSLDTDTRF